MRDKEYTLQTWRQIMFMKTNYRNRTILLSVCMVLFYLLPYGCTQNNESKIIGSWKISLQKIKPNPATIITSWTFDKGGVIKVDTKVTINNKEENYPTLTGKYKFKDESNISYSFDAKNITIKKVSFPDKDSMLFGEEKMERIN